MPVSSRLAAEDAVDEADGREVLHAGEAELAQLLQEVARASMNGSVPLTPASTGVWRTTGSTSRAISTTISLALP